MPHIPEQVVPQNQDIISIVITFEQKNSKIMAAKKVDIMELRQLLLLNEKADIFSKVFGDKFDDKDLSEDLKISESGEIELKYDGQQTLLFGRYNE